LAREKGEMRLEETEPFFLDLNDKLGTPLLRSDMDEEGSLSGWHLPELWSIS